MTTDDRLEIAYSKGKLVKLLIFSVLFLAGGLWMIMTDPESHNFMLSDPIVKAVASYGGAIMGLLGIYFFTKKLFDKKPGLVLDGTGIHDNTGAFSNGFIPWSDVSKIYNTSVRASFASKQHFITIGLVNPEEYISNEKNAVKRYFLNWNVSRYGSPVLISANALKTKHTDLLPLIQDYFEKQKKMAGPATQIV